MRPIAPAREYDVPILAELNNRFAPDGLTLPRSEEFVEAHLDDYRVIRDDDGHVVGCVCIDEYSPSLVELVALAVDPQKQRHGLGAQLIKAAVTLAVEARLPGDLRRLVLRRALSALRLPLPGHREVSGEAPPLCAHVARRVEDRAQALLRFPAGCRRSV